MRILKIAPIYIPLTPHLKYGGIERVVLALSRSFSEKGHEVFVCAPGDSKLSNDKYEYGQLLPTLRRSEWSKPRLSMHDPDSYEKHIESVIEHIARTKPDIIHDHTGNFVLSNCFKEEVSRCGELTNTPIIVTPHEFQRFKKIRFKKRKNITFTVLSEYQRKIFSRYVDVHSVINNGVFTQEYPFCENKRNYLFSLGSIEPDKGQDLAVKVALEARIPLKIGGNIADQRFYDLEIRPFLGKAGIEYIGPLNDKNKKRFFADALAFLGPIRIGDCFSLVRIEALACGTPVVTLKTGSASEAVRNRITGYLIPYHPRNEEETVKEMVKAIQEIEEGSIKSYRCREDAEKRFDWNRITEQYINLYKEMSEKSKEQK